MRARPVGRGRTRRRGGVGAMWAAMRARPVGPGRTRRRGARSGGARGVAGRGGPRGRRTRAPRRAGCCGPGLDQLDGPPAHACTRACAPVRAGGGVGCEGGTGAGLAGAGLAQRTPPHARTYTHPPHTYAAPAAAGGGGLRAVAGLARRAPPHAHTHTHPPNHPHARPAAAGGGGVAFFQPFDLEYVLARRREGNVVIR
jgi:hypothetical protein